MIETRRLWVLEEAGRLVSMTGFNAALPDVVQVGGVFTPVERRGRGHGCAVVAGSLLDARAGGVVEGILFIICPRILYPLGSIGNFNSLSPTSRRRAAAAPGRANPSE